MKIFYDLKHILYITEFLRESCKILTKGFNKEFRPGCLTEHPVHHLVCFSHEAIFLLLFFPAEINQFGKFKQKRMIMILFSMSSITKKKKKSKRD